MTVIAGVIFQILGANGQTGENRITSCLPTIRPECGGGVVSTSTKNTLYSRLN